MTRLILTGHDAGMAELGELTLPSKTALGHRCGVAVRCVLRYQPGTHPSWQKLRLLLEHLQDVEEVLWLDADSLVTNPEVDIWAELDRHPAPLVASRDWGPATPAEEPTHFSLGNFLVRRSAIPMLEAASRMTEWANVPLWEQRAIQELVKQDPARWPVDILPVRILNAVPAELRPAADPWQPGDLLAHLTADAMEARLRWARRFLRQA